MFGEIKYNIRRVYIGIRGFVNTNDLHARPTNKQVYSELGHYSRQQILHAGYHRVFWLAIDAGQLFAARSTFPVTTAGVRYA